ncbi:hypothetical protein [Micromonospora aurantiaca (nom. illeg.)]|uniref:hypothetical protein n=1 Tax=Micromonospora aurantiaca (nom. illeg.) TaxID=47850 RepID=UPI003406DA71
MGDEVFGRAEDDEDDESFLASDEYELAQLAVMLYQRGSQRLAALVGECSSLAWEFLSVDDPWADEETGAILEAEPHVVASFAAEDLDEVLSALKSLVDGSDRRAPNRVRLRDLKPVVGRNWRAALSTALTTDGASNQARRVKLGESHPEEDGLHFTNRWELGTYRVLKEKQSALPPEETIGIFPLPGVRLDGRTWEPDFLVTYKGRAGVIEIDGPHHAGTHRRSNDVSRDRQFRAAGVAYVDRLDVRDTTARSEVVAFVDSFLKRLLEHR